MECSAPSLKIIQHRQVLNVNTVSLTGFSNKFIYLVLIIPVFLLMGEYRELDVIGLPGRVFEYILMIGLFVSLLVYVHGRRLLANRALLLFVCYICFLAVFFINYSLYLGENNFNNILWDVIPLFYWAAILIPVMIGPIQKWKPLIVLMLIAVVLSAMFSLYGIFYDHDIVVKIMGHEKADRIMVHYRLPFAGGYLIPFFVLSLYFIVRYRKNKIIDFAAIFYSGLIVVLLLLAVAGQSRTMLIVLLLSSLLLLNGCLINKLKQVIVVIPLFVAVLLALFVVLVFSNEELASVIDKRFIEPFTGDFSLAIEDVFDDNRDVLYEYTVDTITSNPVLGRGFGGKIETAQGHLATRQDISVSNYIDKMGMVGLVSFLFLNLYFYLRIKKAVLLYRIKHGDNIETKLRELYVAYYPLLFLTSLNIDVLYGYPFVIVHALLVGSLIVENSSRTADLRNRSVAVYG